MNRRGFLAGALVLSGCGGGGSGKAQGPIVTAPKPRTDLVFGYYAGNSITAVETQRHANLFFAADFYGIGEQIAGLLQAKTAGMRTIIMVPAYQRIVTEKVLASSRFSIAALTEKLRVQHVSAKALMPAESLLRLHLAQLANAGALDNCMALYPMDEPDVHGLSDETVMRTNAMVREVMSGFPQLKNTDLAVTFSGSTGSRPGIKSCRYVGIDHYGLGCGVSEVFDDLHQHLEPWQSSLMFPGGCDPWRQDPACFENYAHATPQVAGIVPFIYQTITDGITYRGIRENGLLPLYCAAGGLIRSANAATC